MEKQRHWAFFLLALSAAWSACFSSGIDNPMDSGAAEGLRGHTVSFEKNCTNSVEEFARKSIKPPAKTVEDFPESPTCPGNRFVEWNTARDGRGTAFTAQTPISPNEILVIVYAKWEKLPEAPLPPALPALRVEVFSSTLAFSPMETSTYSGNFASFRLEVSGFKSKADADSVELYLDEPEWLSLDLQDIRFADGTKTFRIKAQYPPWLAFDKAPAQIRLLLGNMPKGYAYEDEPRSIRVVMGDGQTQARPIPVNQANIQEFNRHANTEEGLELHYKLLENVVLEAPAQSKASNWEPIGTESTPFTGSFDGDGHTLSGLVIDEPNSNFQGLFGYINGANAVIKNLGLIELSVSASGNNFVGGLVGENRAGKVQNSYATGSVNGNQYVGGLVGHSYNGRIENSHAMVSVVANHLVGGLVGYNNSGTVENSYATGDVSGIDNVGGLVGQNYGTAQNTATVENSYATGSVSGSNYVGGVVGYNFRTVQNCVALNSSVSASGFNVGRVVGSAGGTNNHARSEGMTMSFQPTPSASWKDGADASASDYGTQYFWEEEPLRWDFTTIWQWGLNNLPILQNVGGAQNHTVP